MKNLHQSDIKINPARIVFKELSKEVVSPMHVHILNIKQCCDLSFRVDVLLHRVSYSTKRNFQTLEDAIFFYEAINLFGSPSKPQTLQELITLENANYDAWKSISLAGIMFPPEFGPNNSIKGGFSYFRRILKERIDSEITPPHPFYFFSSPIEYFILLARYSVKMFSQVKAMFEEVTSTDPSNELKLQLVTKRYQEQEYVLNVSY